MHTNSKSEAEFIRQVHLIVKDLQVHRPVIYWTDFLVTIAVAYAALAGFLLLPNWSWAQLVCYTIGGLGLYRASIFTHELSHQKRGKLDAFRIAWNVLFGIPCMMPTFLYTDHQSHHTNHSFGTKQDAEYFPLGLGPVGVVYAYLFHMFFIPAAAIIRFVFLVPISFLHPAIRDCLWQHASSLANINPNYVRPLPSREEAWTWRMQEIGCFLFGATLFTLMGLEILPWVWLLKLYLIFLLVVTVNYLRALGAHLYISSGDSMTYVGQMLDSTTIEDDLLGVLWAPLGMRYHALHHLLPSLPYYSMATAHRRLMAELPANSPYHQTIRSGLFAAIWELYRNAQRGGPNTTSKQTTASVT